MNKQNKSTNFEGGFTLIELLVVATIIIVLTAIGLVSYRQASRSARNGRRKSDLETVRQSLMLYKSETGCFPDLSPFPDMMNAISDYISEANIVDPKNTFPYIYSYEPSGSCGGGSGAADFTLRAQLEADTTPTPYEISSP
jgi:type II secretory pathway pseudopilin PulG